MRPLADLKFIAQRVIEHVRDNPSPHPLLGEPGPRRSAGACGRGHPLVVRPNGRAACPACERLRKRRRRAEGANW